MSLSACFSWQDKPYIMLPTQDTATLYLDIPSTAQVGLFKDKQCNQFKHGSNLYKSVEKSPDIPIKTLVHKLRGIPTESDYKPSNNYIKKVQIPAGNNLVFTILDEKSMVHRDGSEVSARCAVSFAFSPIKNREYLAIYKSRYIKDRCYVGVVDFVESKTNRKLQKPKTYKNLKKDCSY